jgi:membrane associated rhomboid family serine protease
MKQRALPRRPTSTALTARAQRTVTTVGSGIGVLWIVFAIDQLMGHQLLAYGIHRGTWLGLAGVLFAPFLHHGLWHLVMNSISFALFGGMLHLRRAADFRAVTIWGALGSGLGAWLLSPPGVTTVGLSGVLFAYLGFLMTRGFFERRLVDIALSVFVTWFFGSMVYGVLPIVEAGISWQAHLAGFLTGVICAGRFRRR